MYNKEIDLKWQKKWEEDKIYKYKHEEGKKSEYVLEMFSYPSAAKLHLGHWFNYGLTDCYARMKRMNGVNVFHPMGFDAFGLPAENFAIKTGVHPKDSTEKNIANMEIQLKELGGSYDWDYEIKTCSPEYYKWTQWIFRYLYEKGLAYKKEALVNWCPSCNTVLANEQVIQGECERCGTIVERKKLNQWFFKITDYAEELLTGLNDLEWPELTKKIQQNWIGKSIGADIFFDVDGKDITLQAFTTRPDTIYGVTYIAVAPESDLAKQLIVEEKREEAEEYIQKTLQSSELERQFTDREKTCAFTGSYAINPLTNTKVPIILADYVLESYGTGVVMGVPAHDQRDYELAKKFGIEIIQVIDNLESNADVSEAAFVDKENTKLINSGEFDGLNFEDAKKQIVKKLEEIGKGKNTVKYKLKDWLVSRQRYWGAPIPIVYCPKCGEVLVNESDLPILLPYDVEFKPDGKSPLAKSEEFKKCKCPKCGEDAVREVDTLDTFVCSSWYQLRYPFNNMKDKIFDTEKINEYVPVDVYVGGKEHASMHLIYSRFIYKALRDGGLLKGDEPFKRLIHQGIILGPDGNKMSKSKGNTVSPDEYIDIYGSDALRMYLMFGFAYEDGGAWNPDGIKSISKYLIKIQNLATRIISNDIVFTEMSEKDQKQLAYVMNYTIKGVKEDIIKFSFNTAVAKMMEYTNEMLRIEKIYGNISQLKEAFKNYLLILASLAPHISEELWHQLNGENVQSIHLEKYPTYNEKALIKDEIELAIQVNGKLRDTIMISPNASQEEALEVAKQQENVKRYLQDKEIIKVIYIKGKILNIVIK